MKNVKAWKKLLSLFIAAAAVLTFSACSVEIGGEETWTYTADDKEGTLKLFNDFFQATFENTNQIVAVNAGGKPLFTENIEGTGSYAKYESGTETYAFIDGDTYYYAMSADGSKSYFTTKEEYDYGYRAYKQYLNLEEGLPDGGTCTFECKVDGKKEKNVSNATLTLTVKDGDAGSLTLTAVSQNDLLQTYHYEYQYTENGKTETIKTDMTFTYGSAKVTVPDLTGWYNNTTGK